MPLSIVLPDGDRVEGFASVARGYWQRMLGLMGQRGLPRACGLLFSRCSSIHTYWMRFPIDVVWLSAPLADGRTMGVTRLDRSIPRGRVSIAPKGTWGVLELPGGTLVETPKRVEVDRLTLGDIRQ